MARYEFVCPDCGPFEIERPMARAADPGACPRCRGAARRVFSAPALATLSRPLRRALDAEERSAHEPSVVGAPSGRALPRGIGGHGHAH